MGLMVHQRRHAWVLMTKHSRSWRADSACCMPWVAGAFRSYSGVCVCNALHHCCGVQCAVAVLPKLTASRVLLQCARFVP